MRIGGLASGIDTDSLVKEMMAAQKLPQDKLTQQKAFTEWQKDAYRDVNLSLSNLRTLASDMRLQSSFNSYSSTATGSSVTPETTALSVSGSYKVEVISLAAGAKINSAAPIKSFTNSAVSAKSTDAIGTAGSITIKGSGATATDIVVPILATDTYEQVAKKVQEATAAKVPELRMSFDNTTSSFFISTKGMGGDQNFTMNFSTPELAGQVINAKDAANGNAVITNFSTSTAATNTFMKAASNGSVKFDGITVDNLTSNKTTINGLTLNLVETGTSTITVQADPTKTFDKIKGFIDKYNETIADIEKQLVEKRYPDFQPLSAEQKKEMTDNEIELWEEKARSGLLRNDPILRNAMQELRQSFTSPVAGMPAGSINMLSQIGINTGTWSEGGKLFIDEDKLKKALTDKPDQVMALFTNRVDDKNVGVGGRVYDALNNVVKKLSDKAGSPTSLVDNSQITKYIKQMDEEISRWQTRLEKIEDRYWKQFTAMEKAISQMNSQSSWISQSLGMM
ncbi:flagellar filament capping protein FliD [Planococcus sp. 107-1]|uniref:flagellar filament capping protein FliD n=1 Tax=Planococcus sp. 107-1 TaxID=2908840 RepID=UPI001F471746|nr:flagellar filament capping protein FliD [Planococcus sp. 107-1]UJF27090.1 flagellar filament capping protein FliD [Planococcus sp. 107-1]